jgi:hypothetical protein
MTAPENFVSRWARLKSGSDAESGTELGPGQEVVASVGVETPSVQRQDHGFDEPFDPASLPSIETITVDTDVRGFLRSQVPVALTRAALRKAWASDPAIRDFIGIAESQWDFNDPAAMSGFGPMLETDDMPALLARALDGADKLAGMIPEPPILEENALPAVTGREPTDPDQGVRQTSGTQPVADGICSLSDDSIEGTAIRNDGVSEEDHSSGSRRSHGSALPR